MDYKYSNRRKKEAANVATTVVDVPKMILKHKDSDALQSVESASNQAAQRIRLLSPHPNQVCWFCQILLGHGR